MKTSENRRFSDFLGGIEVEHWLKMGKGSGDFMERNSSLYSVTLPKLITIDIVSMDVKLF